MYVVMEHGPICVTCIQVHCNSRYLQCYVCLLCIMAFFTVLCLKSPFNGEDEDELFEAICSDSPQYPRWLNKHTLNLIDRVSEDGVKD